MTAPTATKIDLLLLGLLLDRPMHGYELYQHIQGEGIDAWFNVSMAGVGAQREQVNLPANGRGPCRVLWGHGGAGRQSRENSPRL
jgi:hypothetical protein